MASPGVAPIPATANEFIEHQLDERLKVIEGVFGAHALTFYGPLSIGVDDILRGVVEKRCQTEPASEKLVILLTTGGGYLEPVQRMVDTIRRHYQNVDFVVPNSAYSAGTVFVMSGDAIHMDYYSRLGPIDPQIESSSGQLVSALGHLEKYNALIEKAEKGEITTAEVQLLIDGFDQAELYHYEQERDLSIQVLREWLVKYKFKNWKETQTTKTAVTEKMKEDRAESIGNKLNDTEKWHSHGYGISMDVLQNDLKLVIDDYGKDKVMSSAIRAYHDLLSDYMGKRGTRGVVHIFRQYRPFM
jgi:Serine dehydrogenase proteinase